VPWVISCNRPSSRLWELRNGRTMSIGAVGTNQSVWMPFTFIFPLLGVIVVSFIAVKNKTKRIAIRKCWWGRGSSVPIVYQKYALMFVKTRIIKECRSLAKCRSSTVGFVPFSGLYLGKLCNSCIRWVPWRRRRSTPINVYEKRIKTDRLLTNVSPSAIFRLSFPQPRFFSLRLSLKARCLFNHFVTLSYLHFFFRIFLNPPIFTFTTAQQNS